MRLAPTRFALRPASGRTYDLLKRSTDLALGLVLLAVAAPAILAGWLAVRLTSRGPGFYSQTRLGRYGRPYRIYKLRSMYHDCEAASGVRWSTRGDNRVTPVGRVLRKLHVDELPQFWNIVLGDMSLVGPRPERPEFVGPLQSQIPGYMGRLKVRPGLTGLAQIQLPPDTGIESVKAKLVRDLHYVGHYSLALDARILFGTAVYLVGFSYAAVRAIAGLPDPGRPGPATVSPRAPQEPVPANAVAAESPAA